MKARDASLSLSLNPGSCSLLGWLSLGEPSSINFTKASWWDAGLSPVLLHKVSHFPSLSHPGTFAQHPSLLRAVIQLSQIRSWTSEQTMPVCNPPASIILLSFLKKSLTFFWLHASCLPPPVWLRFWCSLPFYHSSLSTFLSLMYSTVMSNNNFYFLFQITLYLLVFPCYVTRVRWPQIPTFPSEAISNSLFDCCISLKFHANK